MQLVVLACGMFLLPTLNISTIRQPIFIALVLIVFFGFFSSFLSEWPGWAFKELARYVGLIVLALIIGSLATNQAIYLSIIYLLAAVGTLHACQFLMAYFSAIMSGMFLLDMGLLYDGFSNPRFFGQFQVLLMPVLAAIVLKLKKTSPMFCGLFFAILIIQWCIALALGGRGLWAALLVSHLVLIMAARNYWRTVAMQAMGLFFGGALFFVLFWLVPSGLEVEARSISGLRSTLSLRGILWQSAIAMVADAPWIGAGPMHFSAEFNYVGAHPHQVILQWAAEWGIPATVLAILVGSWGLSRSLTALRQGRSDYLGVGVWLAIASALVLAQADGVFVMPYVETWLAVMVGLSIARYPEAEIGPLSQKRSLIALALPAAVCLSYVIIVEGPTVEARVEAYIANESKRLLPRFWSQGWIDESYW